MSEVLKDEKELELDFNDVDFDDGLDSVEFDFGNEEIILEVDRDIDFDGKYEIDLDDTDIDFDESFDIFNEEPMSFDKFLEEGEEGIYEEIDLDLDETDLDDVLDELDLDSLELDEDCEDDIDTDSFFDEV